MSSTNTVYVPSLLDCSQKEAADYLLEHRFKNSATEAATFLLQILEQIPNVEELSAQLQESNDDEEKAEKDSSCGEALALPVAIPNDDGSIAASSAITVSGTTPRAKFSLSIHKDVLALTFKQETIILKPPDIKYFILFPKREDCIQSPKKDRKHSDRIVIPGSMTLVILSNESNVSFKGKKMTQICFQLEKHLSDPLTNQQIEAEHSLEKLGKLCVDSYHSKLCQMFQSTLHLNHEQMAFAFNPNYAKFKGLNKSSMYTFKSEENGSSSTMSSGMPWLTCHKGVQDGVLYPLKEGLMFFKPPLFVPRSQLHSISCGRGSNSSRYVDLVVTLDPLDDGESQEKENLEFTNIDREELQVMNGYINVLIQEMSQDITEDKVMDAAEVIEVESEEDIDEANVTGNRKQRLASKEARQATKRELISNSEIDDEDGSDDDSEDDDYNFVEAVDDEGEEELADIDNDAIEVVNIGSDDDIEVVKVTTTKRKQRIASMGAVEATQIELNNVESNSDDDDDDYKFVEKDSEEECEIDDNSESEEVTDSEDDTNEPIRKKPRER